MMGPIISGGERRKDGLHDAPLSGVEGCFQGNALSTAFSTAPALVPLPAFKHFRRLLVGFTRFLRGAYQGDQFFPRVTIYLKYPQFYPSRGLEFSIQFLLFSFSCFLSREKALGACPIPPLAYHASPHGTPKPRASLFSLSRRNHNRRLHISPPRRPHPQIPPPHLPHPPRPLPSPFLRPILPFPVPLLIFPLPNPRYQ